MEEIVLHILDELRSGREVDARALSRIVHAHLRRLNATGMHADKRQFAKRHILAFVERIKHDDPLCWERWGLDAELEIRLIAALRVKPRRSASGVATITVITKPWPCRGNCVFCPSDIRMPKSYLHNEPACERAEQCGFDPYLQVYTRLSALSAMGHSTDKVELIVLGGTWSDYPETYQRWFVRELFRALNEFPTTRNVAPETRSLEGEAEQTYPRTGSARARAYESARGFGEHPEPTEAMISAQAAIDAGRSTYNEAWQRVYGDDDAYRGRARLQCATQDELVFEQCQNEQAACRSVGLVIETRPDAVSAHSLAFLRLLGATKIQMGVQSLHQDILNANGRDISVEQIARAFELLRAFGFKLHIHTMLNLKGSTPALDREDYRRLVHECHFQPDEVKLYPCALIASSRLIDSFQGGSWTPYTEEELVDLLVDDVRQTPAFCRISRMIRDFSSTDIVAGNKKPNLRQMVENRLRASSTPVQEMRFREIATHEFDQERLKLRDMVYETSNTTEHFLSWAEDTGTLVAFCRLSLPHASYIEAHAHELYVKPGEAMIRELHVYGKVARLGEEGQMAQHTGLGRRLLERAAEIAKAGGYHALNVISAVGTREYYRKVGFVDNGLYQQRTLIYDDATVTH